MRQHPQKILTVVLRLVSRGVLWRHQPRIIAITGSVGKTSTKDAIYTVLKSSGGVRRSEKSYNSELGVELTIIGAKSGGRNPFAWLAVIGIGLWQIAKPKGKGSYPKTLVLEVGADRPGDISEIAKWLRPHVVVLTRFPGVPVHIEFFPTLDALIEEKLSLAKALRKEGMLVLNADDRRVLEAKEIVRARTTTYGTREGVNLRASNLRILPDGLFFKVDFDGKSFPVQLLGIYTESYVTVALAALTVAYVSGMNMVTAIGELRDYETPPGRVHLIVGMKGSVLIDDTYNSSPAACEAGLQMLKDIPFGKRKLAVIGDMLELGKHTNDAHVAIGRLAKGCADLLVTVGLRAKECAAGAEAAGMAKGKIASFADAVSAGQYLEGVIAAGDIVFVKGSERMRMERLVKMLMAEPERAEELLVRQEPEWRKEKSL